MTGLFANSDMGVGEIDKFCILSPEARQLIELSVRRMQLSARAYHRVLKLSRTIADLADSDRIEVAARRRSHAVPPQAADHVADSAIARIIGRFVARPGAAAYPLWNFCSSP